MVFLTHSFSVSRYKDAKFPVGDGDESNLAYKVELEDQPWVVQPTKKTQIS